jgi:hypothetical protein
MVQLKLPPSANERPEDVYHKELARLRKPGALGKRLIEFDRIKPVRRIYIMGCGRSGTWLLTGVMSSFKDVEVVGAELTVEHFGLFQTDRSTLILKRDSRAYQTIKDIPQQIEIVYIVRHPFEVLTSHLAGSQRSYHILPDRWLGEMSALQYLFATRRENAKIVRFEDLVSSPVELHAELATFFDLQIEVPIDKVADISKDAIGKHKQSVDKIRYLQRIKPDLGDMLSWVANTYHYDVSLPP